MILYINIRMILPHRLIQVSETNVVYNRLILSSPGVRWCRLPHHYQQPLRRFLGVSAYFSRRRANFSRRSTTIVLLLRPTPSHGIEHGSVGSLFPARIRFNWCWILQSLQKSLFNEYI